MYIYLRLELKKKIGFLQEKGEKKCEKSFLQTLSYETVFKFQ